MRVVDGPPEELKDTDKDGVSDFFEDAFGTNKNAQDANRLPATITVKDGGQSFFGVEFDVAAGVTINAQNEIDADGYIYSFELTEDFINWRPAGVEIVVTTGAIDNGRTSIIARLTEPLLEATDACYMRTKVRRQ
jgi:hypothetical protein